MGSGEECKVKNVEFYQAEENSILKRAVQWLADIAVVLCLAWFSVYAFGTQVQISGQSMTPCLQAGDVVLMNRLSYDLGSPDRMDVVVFQREDRRANVKRVIGLPGETVQIRQGRIWIDGKELETEPELSRVSLAGLAENPVLLGEDEYFLLGDNRDSSEDSRFVNIGNVKREQILGKVWLRVMPLVDLQLIQ